MRSKIEIGVLVMALMIGLSNGAYAKLGELNKRWNNSFKGIESFEGDSIPKGWEAYSSELMLSNMHHKHGEKSLRWHFSSKGRILVRNKKLEKAGKSSNGGIKAWIYNEKPCEGQLTFRFGSEKDIKSGDVPYEFGFKLNFKGWRAFWVHFREDACVGTPSNNLEVMEVLAPDGKGEIFWDNLEFCQNVSWKRSDDQFKIIQNEVDHFGLTHPWEYTNYWSKQPVIPVKDYSWNKNIASRIHSIEHNYLTWVLGEDPSMDYAPMQIRRKRVNELIEKGKQQFSSFKVKRHPDGRVTGLPLFSIREGHSPFFADLSMHVALSLALDYRLNGNKKSLQNYLLMVDYMHDQGWAKGSSLGTIDHEMLRHAGYFHSLFLMKEELKRTHRLNRELETAKWYLNWGELYNMPEYTGCTADFMRTLFMYRLLVILSHEDGPGKARDMDLYLKWINMSLKVSPGFADTFKPDFTGYHHRGVYMNAYAPNGYHLASVICYLLHGTGYDVSEEGRENLKKAILTARLMCAHYSIPMGVCGRFPENDTNYKDIIPSLAYMSMVSDGKDGELIGAFKQFYDVNDPVLRSGLFCRAESNLEYAHTLGAIDVMRKVDNLAPKATPLPSGNWFKPYAGLSIHRRDDWMVSAKGWSAYIWDFESGKGENVFGRYLSYGALQFFTAGEPVSAQASGYEPRKGWDWSRIPGTTSISLPLAKMQHRKKGVSKIYREGKHRNLSDQTFLGGVSDEQGNGCFALKLHDNAFDPSFWARKSIFFYDDLVVCIGDGIRNRDSIHSTQTTIFQCYGDGKQIYVNGESMGAKFQELNISNDDSWIIGSDDNGYYIPKGQSLKVRFGLQHSMDESGRKPTNGEYFTAWLDHGKAPVNAGYEYAVRVRGVLNDKANIEKGKTYKVYQKNENAHIVKIHNTLNYVIWNSEFESEYGSLISISTPGIVMITQMGKTMNLTFTDPDLRRPQMTNTSGMKHENVMARSYSRKVRIVVRGKWKPINNCSVKRVGTISQSTVLEVECKDGEGYHVQLKAVN